MEFNQKSEYKKQREVLKWQQNHQHLGINISQNIKLRYSQPEIRFKGK